MKIAFLPSVQSEERLTVAFRMFAFSVFIAGFAVIAVSASFSSFGREVWLAAMSCASSMFVFLLWRFGGSLGVSSERGPKAVAVDWVSHPLEWVAITILALSFVLFAATEPAHTPVWYFAASFISSAGGYVAIATFDRNRSAARGSR